MELFDRFNRYTSLANELDIKMSEFTKELTKEFHSKGCDLRDVELVLSRCVQTTLVELIMTNVFNVFEGEEKVNDR